VGGQEISGKDKVKHWSELNGRPIAMTGTAVWTVNEGGKP